MIPTRPAQARPTWATVTFIGAGAATALAGAALMFGVQPATDLSDHFWRDPRSSSVAFVVFSIFSAALHGLVVAGLLAFGRTGAAGRTWSPPAECPPSTPIRWPQGPRASSYSWNAMSTSVGRGIPGEERRFRDHRSVRSG